MSILRDIRLTSAGIPRRTANTLLSKASGFARDIADRYRLRQLYEAAADLRYKRRDHSTMLQAVHHHQSVTVMARINLGSMHLPTRSILLQGEPSTTTSVPEKPFFVQLSSKTSPSSIAGYEQVSQRLMLRGKRVEEVSRQRQAVSTPSLTELTDRAPSVTTSDKAMTEIRPVQRVVRHTAGPKQIAAEQAGAGERSPAGRPGPHFEPVPAAPPQLPALDINRLTEQVIQAIDRRIIAQRERMGRV